MEYDIHEKIVLITLSFLLLAGSVMLHVRNSRPLAGITVHENAIKKELTLKEVKDILDEKRRVNVNEASPEELTVIPGIGEKMASRIIDRREAYGDFFTEKDLLKVKGIGEKKLEKMREWIRFD